MRRCRGGGWVGGLGVGHTSTNNEVLLFSFKGERVKGSRVTVIFLSYCRALLNLLGVCKYIYRTSHTVNFIYTKNFTK